MTKITYVKANGRMLANARKMAGVEQSELARLCGLSTVTILHAENGKFEHRRKKPSSIEKVLTALKVNFRHDEQGCIEIELR